MRKSSFNKGGMRMFGIGMTELIVVLVIILIIFGANKLPEIGAGMGRAIKNFRKATTEPEEIEVGSKDQTKTDKTPENKT
jgi:sec-independent protein translocase protein TatA